MHSTWAPLFYFYLQSLPLAAPPPPSRPRPSRSSFSSDPHTLASGSFPAFRSPFAILTLKCHPFPVFAVLFIHLQVLP